MEAARARRLPAGSSAGLLESLSGFVKELRAAGIPVSLTENLDAMEALRHIPLEDREAFRYALAATMVKNNAHWKAFETVFEVYFSLRGGSTTSPTTVQVTAPSTSSSPICSAPARAKAAAPKDSRPSSWQRCSTGP